MMGLLEQMEDRPVEGFILDETASGEHLLSSSGGTGLSGFFSLWRWGKACGLWDVRFWPDSVVFGSWGGAKVDEHG